MLATFSSTQVLEGKWLWTTTSTYSETQTALLEDGQWHTPIRLRAHSLNALFVSIQQALRRQSISLSDLSGFVYDRGPGSTLGIRIARIALGTLRTLPQGAHLKLFCFQALKVATLLADPPHRPIISEATLGKWNFYDPQKDTLSTISQADLMALNIPVYHLSQRPHTHTPPRHAHALSFSFSFSVEQATDRITPHPPL